ncbi:MAG: AI-2E family transporter [Gemmatimonadota bacterium]|nr:AI-2E family transporter [Gemmatimonadota bacterium]
MVTNERQQRISLTPILRWLIAGACAVVIISGLKAAAPVANPLLLALLIVPMIVPVQQWLIRRGVNRSVATALTVVVVIIGLVAVILFVGTSVAEMARRLPTYAPKLNVLRDSLFAQLEARGVDTSGFSFEYAPDPQRLLGFASQTVRLLGKALSDALFVVLLLAFALPLLVRNESANEKLRDRERAVSMEEHFSDVRKYVRITGICGLINGAIALILLLYLHIDFAITWAVLFVLMNFVPAVGFVFALVPPLLLALVEYGWTTAIVVAIFYSVLNFIVDSVLKPRFMAEGLDLSPLVVIVALVFWSWVLGPIGAIVAVPITMVLRKFALQYAAGDSHIIVSS